MKRNPLCCLCGILAVSLIFVSCGGAKADSAAEDALPVQCRAESASGPEALASGFVRPPAGARPWVYWFVMDGNLSREGITADLEAMRRVGIGGAIFLEVNVGVPRGPVDFMSDEWIGLFGHAAREAERLGIELTLISGPGWTGSGGPWVKPEDAMHFVVTDTISVRGGGKVSVELPRPRPRDPYFGNGNLTPSMLAQKESFYTDLFTLAYPKISGGASIPGIDEKALYVRHPYTSRPNTNPGLDAPAGFGPDTPGTALSPDKCIDVTGYVSPEGVLEWDAPEGDWTIYRFVGTVTGANTRPAPLPGVGFECSKMDTAALNHHLDAFVGRLAEAAGLKPGEHRAGWNMLHIDSWEMGPQNWSDDFREQFRKRRGYDLLPYMGVLSGQVVGSRELSERFLWDFRQTAQELVLENHARHLKRVAHRYGLGLSIEPYDMNPNNDIALGSVADVPMCEFWEKDDLFNSAFSCVEAVSAAHTNGRPIVAAESFTGHDSKSWRKNPSNMKDQADWAFCAGINRIVFHRYAHQPWLDRYPGMTMGMYGMQYERTQTWWELSDSWHDYLARCQYMLRQGVPVADILYLTPEGAPHAFTPPASALDGTPRMPDRKGYNFDGCDPATLIGRASVSDGRIVFPGGMSYGVLVLPNTQTMTPGLLDKIGELLRDGATVVGYAPLQSPGLEGYPQCDERIREQTARIWGERAQESGWRECGRGRLFVPEASDTVRLALSPQGFTPPYVPYGVVAALLESGGTLPDFESTVPMRYVHRRSAGMDIYMVSNVSGSPVTAECTFRSAAPRATLWCAETGRIAPAEVAATGDGRSRITLPLEGNGAVFVVFGEDELEKTCNTERFRPELEPVAEIEGPWKVAFQPDHGAPDSTVFPVLGDWSRHSDPGIRYFSGIADYRSTFDMTPQQAASGRQWFLDLGQVAVMARVTVNGHPVAGLWKAPYVCDITPYIKEGDNTLDISVANEWPNRMIGDLSLPEGKRITYSTYNNFTKDSELLPSGLLGPVRLLGSK